MDTLFVLDRKDYTTDMPVIERVCVRGLIRRGDKLVFQRSACGEYKLPGGGVEQDESPLSTLQREVLEETGLDLILSSVREIGEVVEKRQDVFTPGLIYLNHTLFYCCEVTDEQKTLSLTPEEKAKGYTAVWETIDTVIRANNRIQSEYWRRRDTLFLEWYLENIKKQS